MDLKKVGSQVKKNLGISNVSTGGLTKLKIGSYEAYLNPSQISHNIKVNFSKEEAKTVDKGDGQKSASPTTDTNPSSVDPETLSFDLLLDGTGATGVPTNVDGEITELKKVLFDTISDKKKRKEKLSISWGSAIAFTGHVESFDITYSLFNSDGTSLRATVKLSFVGSSIDGAKFDRGKNTTKIDIDQAKTIANACAAVYSSPAAYVAVAKVNKLTNVRSLKPGTSLVFPPKKSE